MPTLKCPACDLPLDSQSDGSWRCADGHQFDRAKRGYTNLLLAQHRRSRDPGDDKAMVQARTRFLEKGRYQPLMDCLAELVGARPRPWLDIGCGEGWYSERLAQLLGAENGVGVDISKHAIDWAARRNRQLTWLVASGARLPLFNHSQQAVLVLFTRLFSDEIARVLQPGGDLFVVGTGEDHLLSLRQALYQQVRQRPFDSSRFLDGRFELQQSREVRFQWLPEDLQELTDLLAMTPHHWRTTREAKAGLHTLLGTPMGAHFIVQHWQKRALPSPPSATPPSTT